MRVFFNILYILRDFYKNFGLIPSIVFVLFLFSVSVFLIFEIVKIFLPFTYVAF